jgi:Sulfatase
VRIWLKIGGITLGLLAGAGSVVERVRTLGSSFELVAYSGLLAFLALCLFAAAFVRSGWLRWSLAFAFAAAATTVDSFESAAGDAMSYDAFINMINSAGSIGEAWAQHGVKIAVAGATGLLLALGIGLKPATAPHWGPFRKPVVALVLPFAGLALLSAILFLRGGEGGRGLPSAWVGSSYAALYGFEAVATPRGPRKPVSLARPSSPITHDIVLIVDESVVGHYLDINSELGVRSGLASAQKGATITNFGIAAAITTCSYGSNMTLRHGGSRENYRRINETMPSLWAYAHRAGLKTVFIDAQSNHGALHNGMTQAERSEIDRFIQFDDVAVTMRDMAVADALARALSNDLPEFIYVNKVGAHFPVADKYPDELARYQPALPRGHAMNVTATAIRGKMGDDPETWRRYRNAYRNTLLWNVGAFFDRFFSKAVIGDALIIYTSDHGQDLHERGNPGTTTHCNSDPVIEEGLVPLVLIEGKGKNRWQDAARRNFNASSHYRIAPTILREMGYDADAIRNTYGDALDSSTRDPMSFNSLFNARLGRKPQWTAIPLDRIASPPVADYVKP